LKGWIRLGLEKGIITTSFPREKPEVLSPWATEPVRIYPGATECPTNAIDGDMVDRFRCIYCGRCSSSFAPTERLNVPEVKAKVKLFAKSMKLFVIDTGSCGGCNSEVQQLWNPIYDLSRLGVFFTNTPRHADALLVVGILAEGMEKPLLEAYSAIPDPKIVFAVGSCSVSGGILGKSVASVLDCKVLIPGCPPDPFSIIDAIQKSRGLE